MKYHGITILKNKKCNTWYCRYRKNGRQFYISAKTQKQCYDKLRKALAKFENKNDITKNNLTLQTWIDKWLETYKKGKVKETTLLDYRASFKYMQSIMKFDLKDLTNLKITQMLNRITFERRKQKVYELLNDILNRAVKNGLIERNPIVDEKPKHKRINGISLSLEDQQKLETCCRENKKFKIFLVAMLQGLRKGEVLALTKSDFDFTNKTLRINKSLNIFGNIDTTKNDFSNRVMPLFDKTIKILDLDGLKDDERIFDISQPWCTQLFEKLKEECNLNQKYTIHSLRHTFITNCQEKQIPLHIIQSWVGHNIGSTVTSQIYTHAREGADLKYINTLNNM